MKRANERERRDSMVAGRYMVEKPEEEKEEADFSKMVKQREVREFVQEFKSQGHTVAGINALMNIVYRAQGKNPKTKAVLAETREVLEKLKKKGGWFSFLSDLKLTPEGLFKKKAEA